ncbi:MAG: metal ABC transporter permease [Sphaerochaetaceae bacterium]|nr:metal ABC transporter permease [Sphaerochaetaceae bacterium]MDC7238645.1 metal ABC transporter permease [Sphaerochaetaceae bacterium]MDC7249001.1 metal ABC transporter permease [Sphaerochaetaceae bacterium]
MLSLLTLEPIFKAFIAIILSSISFPLCGVMVLRLDLVPLRYALMHGVILGGALALALSLPTLPIIILVNLIVVLLIIKIPSSNSFSSAAAMVFTMGLASLLMHTFNVPAKDSLQLLWGSPFALSYLDLTILAILTITVILYLILNFNNIVSIFFDKSIARSLGVKVELNYNFMVIIIALCVALAMRLIGALLIDALLILPVLIATRVSKATKSLFIYSSVFGFILSISGFFTTLYFNLPLSATIAIIAVALYIVISIIKNIKIRNLK